MGRLNSVIFRIFRLGAWNLNLNSSDCRASKIISNNTKLEAIPRELDVENPLFSFCVGVWGTVCDKLFICIKRCVRKFHIFWYQCRPGGRWRKYGFEWKTDQKSEITGVEIAWVEEKSNRYPLYYTRKWPTWKDKHIGWLLECNTHAFCCCPRNLKILTIILKSISQGILISPKSAWFTESVPIFWIEKNFNTKKLFRFLIPKFNLNMGHII